MALPSKLTAPWTFGQARAAINSLIDLAGNGTSGSRTMITTATYTVTEAGDYIATRSTTLTMPSGARVALSAGQFVVVIDIGGDLWVSEVGTLTDGGPAPTPKIQVTPAGPSWTDDAENGGGTWSTPAQAGVTYSPSGTNQAAGGGATVTWTAAPATGYEFPAGVTTTWLHTFPAAPVIVSATHRATRKQNAEGTAKLTTATFADVPLGAATADRVVLIAAGAVGESIASIKIAGVSLSLLTSQGYAGERPSIWAAAIPTGATGTMEVTFAAAGATSVVLGVATLTGVKPVPYATVPLATGNIALPASPAGSLAVAVAIVAKANEGPFQWGGDGFASLFGEAGLNTSASPAYYVGAGHGITTGSTSQSTGFKKANGFSDVPHAVAIFPKLDA